MSEPIDDGGEAFPSGSYFPGMTLRDYFAAKAMHGCLSLGNRSQSDIRGLAKYSYELSDAMIAQRKESP